MGATVRLFHRTTADGAEVILRDGFRDGRGHYLTESEHVGVWLSDRPLDANDGAEGNAILVVEAPVGEVDPFEWVEEGKGYREFLIPAAVVNGWPRDRATDEDQEPGPDPDRS
jgi:hypothetical protein